MTDQTEQKVPPSALWGIWRVSDPRALAGVAGGISARLNVDVTLVRLMFVVLSFAGGFGALAYVTMWAALPESAAPITPIRHSQASPPIQLAAVASICLGFLLLLKDIGLWFGDAVVWPFALAGLGAGVIFLRSGPDGHISRVTGGLTPSRLEVARLSPFRVAAGAALIVGGMGLVLQASNVISTATSFLIPVLVTLAGVTLIFGPWLWNLAQQLQEERRERIRTEERAEVAAHLHDSVLQTLALIQRTESPQQIALLARRQERELRAWLFGQGRNSATSLKAAADDLATRIEGLHGVNVEVVVVGEIEITEQVEALLGASGEALTNAARHSGAPSVSLFLEVEEESVAAFIRDTGRGFDPAAIDADRRGITESIKGRVERHHGTVEIVSAPGDGTEVRLTVPRKSA